MPRSISVAGAQPALAEIAAALLAEGLLQPEDWQGELYETVVQGLNAWLLREDAGVMERFPLYLAFTDDVCDDSLEGDGWRKTFHGVKGQPVGAFGLVFDGNVIAHARVGRRISELERLEPGAGLSVLAVVEQALYRTVGAYTPARAYADLYETDWDYTEDEAAERDLLTFDKFCSLVPEQICRAGIDEAALRRTLRRRSTLAPPLREIVRQALDLRPQLPALCTDETRHFDHALSSGYQVPPVSLSWLPDEDPTIRCLDDFLEMLSQDSHTDYCWLAGFQVCRPETVRAAARKTAETVRLLVRVDRLLDALDSGEEPLPLPGQQGEKSRRRRRVPPLVETLGR